MSASLRQNIPKANELFAKKSKKKFFFNNFERLVEMQKNYIINTISNQ